MSETKTFQELFLSECKEQNLSVKELKILLVTDIHKNFEFLERLKEWQLEKKQLFDYIFCTGDILSLKYPELEDNEVIAYGEAEIASIISYLENMSLNVIYIGGNHDPKSLFEVELPTLTIKSINLHKRFHKLANDLYLIGLGGAVPGIESQYNVKDKNFIPYQDTTDKVPFIGYPYNDNHINPNYTKSGKLYNDDLNLLWKSVNAEISEINTTPNIKFILLTHNGPFYSSTSIMNYRDKCAYMGSKGLDEFLKENENVFLNIHGHTHAGLGYVSFNTYSVINAGALTEGNFAVLTLKRNHVDEWKVANVEFNNLGYK
jgi:Icc-related predicted phosphoesterase